MRSLVIGVLATLAATPLAAQVGTAPRDSLALARKFTRWFYAAQWDSLLAHQPVEIRGDTTLRPQLAQRLEQLRARGSQEVEVLEEKWVTRNGFPQYWRVARFSNLPEPLLVRWIINGRGELVGMAISALSQAPPVDSVNADSTSP
jgi:hypothetical protein